jgi:L-ascorbate metabolism protein UlaG (beta-lactamase superfamily)
MTKYNRMFLAILIALVQLILLSSCATSPVLTVTTPEAATITPRASIVQIQWLGQSGFLITSSQNTKILLDPPSPSTGYTIPPLEGIDAITVSHEHSDHNFVNLATGSPLVLRGLAGAGWNAVNQTVKDVHILSISPANAIYHDNSQGSQRGLDSIFILEVDGLRIAHLGDLGNVLTPESVQAMGAIDVVLVPVGGVYTIDAAGATQVVGQLNPRIAIPMHYKTPKVPNTWPGTGVEPFLDGKKLVERPNSNLIKLSKSSLPSQTTFVVLNYE